MRLVSIISGCVFFLNVHAFCQEIRLELVAGIKNANVYKHKDLLIKLALFNDTGKDILIHKHIAYGYISMCMDDYCFESEKYVNGNYQKMKENSAIDRIPGYDSTGKPWDEMYDTLEAGAYSLEKLNINGYYDFNKGKYRVRFSFQIPVKNNLPDKKVFSNWLYFEVKSKHVDFDF